MTVNLRILTSDCQSENAKVDTNDCQSECQGGLSVCQSEDTEDVTTFPVYQMTGDCQSENPKMDTDFISENPKLDTDCHSQNPNAVCVMKGIGAWGEGGVFSLFIVHMYTYVGWSWGEAVISLVGHAAHLFGGGGWGMGGGGGLL